MSVTVSAEVKQKDPAAYDKFLRIITEQGKNEVAVGFPRGKAGVGNAHYESGASILQVAMWNNFGTEHIPPRPFMYNANKDIQVMWMELCKKSQRRINKGEISPRTVMLAAGLKAEAILRMEITTLNYPPNSPTTILRKKSSNPLIDSGDMRKYVSSVVRPTSSGKGSVQPSLAPTRSLANYKPDWTGIRMAIATVQKEAAFKRMNTNPATGRQWKFTGQFSKGLKPRKK